MEGRISCSRSLRDRYDKGNPLMSKPSTVVGTEKVLARKSSSFRKQSKRRRVASKEAPYFVSDVPKILLDALQSRNSFTQLFNHMLYVVNELKKETQSIEKQDLVEQLFESFYKIGKSGQQLTEDQVSQVVKSVEEIQSEIDDCVFTLGLEFNSDRGSDYLILRSGIQFLLDGFPGAKRTGPFLNDINLEYLESFDEELTNWKNNPYFTLESVSHSAEDLTRPKFIPKSHSWWY